MKGSDIVTHLRKTLPVISDKLTNNFTISSMSAVGTTVTVETGAAHGMTVGVSAIILGTKVKTPVTILTSVGTIASVTTSPAHDATRRYSDEISQCEIVGADQSDYNGTFDIIAVEDRFKYTYQLNVDPSIDTATGTIIMLEDRLDGYNGVFAVASVPTSTSFTYELPQAASGDPEFSNGAVRTKFRIKHAVSFETAQNEYTKNTIDTYSIFVVMGDAEPDRSRINNSDFPNVGSTFTEKFMNIQRPINVYVFVPSKDDLGGGQIRDDMEDFAIPMYTALHGFAPPGQTQTSNSQTLMSNGHGLALYEDSLYVHMFQFVGAEQLSISDSYQSLTRAFRDATLTINNANEEPIMTTAIELDK